VQYQHLTFEQRANLLYLDWDVLHSFSTLPDIQKWLESLSKADHLLLFHLHAAYWVATPNATLSFGQTKAKFWNAVNNAGAFIDDLFVVQHDVPLVAVTVESFLVRTVGQCVQFLSRHHLTVSDIWNVPFENLPYCAALDATVHPRYDVLIVA
jgi:hypothetical protein